MSESSAAPSRRSPRVAVLMTGTYREVEFLLQLFAHMAGPVEYDIFAVLRHVGAESSRRGLPEKDFRLATLGALASERLFLCELPSIEPAALEARYLIPTGPASEERERAQLSMFHGVFAAVSMMRSSMRRYTHVMKTRTDYLPWLTPWLSGMLDEYDRSAGRIIVDGLMTRPRRYADRSDIPWQGSLSEVFCFAAVDRFLALWDIEDILPKIWTGVAETTLFRAALLRLMGDELQTERRNATFLKKHFTWRPNETKECFHLLRAGVLTVELKRTILDLMRSGPVGADLTYQLIRNSYDFIVGAVGEAELKRVVSESPLAADADSYMELCRAAVAGVRPV